MANANVAFGFKPVGKHGSSPATQGTSQYFIASDASAIFKVHQSRRINWWNYSDRICNW